MSILLSPKFNLIEKNGKNKDRIYNKPTIVNDLKKEVDLKLNEILYKPYFRNRMKNEKSLKQLIEKLIENEYDEIMYISEHFRYTERVKRTALKAIKEIDYNVDKLAKIGSSEKIYKYSNR